MNFMICTNEAAYTTLPMGVLHPSEIIRDEEERVYTAFEYALSARLSAWGHTTCVNSMELSALLIQPATGPIHRAAFSTQPMPALKPLSRSSSLGKRYLMLSCFAVLCLCAGFDLMGLLVLYVR